MLFSGLHRRHTPRHTASGLCGRARAWVGLLLALLLLSTLAPAISRTLDHGKPLAERGWVEVCSAHGLSWVRADDGTGTLTSDVLQAAIAPWPPTAARRRPVLTAGASRLQPSRLALPGPGTHSPRPPHTRPWPGGHPFRSDTPGCAAP